MSQFFVTVVNKKERKDPKKAFFDKKSIETDIYVKKNIPM